MSDELRTLLSSLFSPACAVTLTKVTVEQVPVRLQLTATAPAMCCPGCAVLSSFIHSRYRRHLTGPPLGLPRRPYTADGPEVRVPPVDLHAPHLHGMPAGLCRHVCSEHLSAGQSPSGHRRRPRWERRGPDKTHTPMHNVKRPEQRALEPGSWKTRRSSEDIPRRDRPRLPTISQGQFE
jgi:hypothetical protein